MKCAKNFGGLFNIEQKKKKSQPGKKELEFFSEFKPTICVTSGLKGPSSKTRGILPGLDYYYSWETLNLDQRSVWFTQA